MASGGIQSPCTSSTRAGMAATGAAGSAGAASMASARGRFPALARAAAEDVFEVARAPHGEQVLAHPAEAAAGVEALRAVVAGPDADPERARAVALEPLQRGVQHAPAPAAGLVRGQQVQALQFPVARRHLGVARK